MKVYFYYPSIGIGGVQALFIRYCCALTQKKIDAEIVGEEIIGYFKTGEKFINQNNIKVRKINFIEWFVSLVFRHNYIVITTANFWLNFYFIVLSILGKKICFWSLQPSHFLYSRKNYIYNKFVQIYFNYLAKRGKTLFMEEGYKIGAEKHFNYKFSKPVIMPVADFFDDEIPKISYTEVKEDQIKILWVGRLNEDWKILTLLPLVNLAKESAFIHLTIVGSSVSDKMKIPFWLNNILKGGYNDKNNISLLLDLENETLKNEYPKHDMVCGMGTILIEAASKCLPAFSQDMYDDSGYGLWLFNRTGYSLGGIDIVKKSDKKIHMKEAIREVIRNKTEISIQCFEHAKKYHNLNEISERLLQVPCS